MKITRLVIMLDTFSMRLHARKLYRTIRGEIALEICETSIRRKDTGGPEPPPVAPEGSLVGRRLRNPWNSPAQLVARSTT
jgi:hypothetical protein